MIQKNIDENDLIHLIKTCGNQIFQTGQNTFVQDQQLDFSLSSSENQQTYIRKPLTNRQNKFKKKNLYARDYISPYSKNYMKKGVTSRTTLMNYQKMTKQISKKIQKIESQEKQVVNIKKDKRNQFYKNVKPRYMQQKSPFKNYQNYAQQNFYKSLKTQTAISQKKYSKQQKQKKWNSFLQRQNKWQDKKKTNVTKARIQKIAQTDQQMSKKIKPIQIPPLSIQDCLGKLKRQTIKLKQQLQNHRFEPNIYHTQRISKRSRSRSKSKISVFGQKIKNINFTKTKRQRNQQETERKIPIVKDPIRQLKFMIN